MKAFIEISTSQFKLPEQANKNYPKNLLSLLSDKYKSIIKHDTFSSKVEKDGMNTILTCEIQDHYLDEQSNSRRNIQKQVKVIINGNKLLELTSAIITPDTPSRQELLEKEKRKISAYIKEISESCSFLTSNSNNSNNDSSKSNAPDQESKLNLEEMLRSGSQHTKLFSSDSSENSCGVNISFYYFKKWKLQYITNPRIIALFTSTKEILESPDCFTVYAKKFPEQVKKFENESSSEFYQRVAKKFYNDERYLNKRKNSKLLYKKYKPRKFSPEVIFKSTSTYNENGKTYYAISKEYMFYINNYAIIFQYLVFVPDINDNSKIADTYFDSMEMLIDILIEGVSLSSK